MHKLYIRRWLDRKLGNSYYSFRLELTDGTVIINPMEYGSGQHPEREALKIIRDRGIVGPDIYYPRECMDIVDYGYGLQRDMFKG